MKAEKFRIAKYLDSPILHVLRSHQTVLRWLSQQEPVDIVPDAYVEPLQSLEKLGVVYKRNNRTFGLRRQRLRQILDRESAHLSVPYTLGDLLGSSP